MHHQSFSLFLANTTPLNINNTTKHTVNFFFLQSSLRRTREGKSNSILVSFHFGVEIPRGSISFLFFSLREKLNPWPFIEIPDVCVEIELKSRRDSRCLCWEIESLTFRRDSSSCWSVRWTLTWSLGEYEAAFIRFEILMAFQWRWRLRVLGVRLNQFRIGMTLGWIWWWLRNPDLGVDELGLWPKRSPFQWNITLRFCHTLAH